MAAHTSRGLLKNVLHRKTPPPPYPTILIQWEVVQTHANLHASNSVLKPSNL